MDIHFFNSNPAINAAQYSKNRFDLLLQLEESGNPATKIYIDSERYVTIGLGFNLSDRGILDVVLEECFGFTLSNPADLSYRNQIYSIVTGKQSAGITERSIQSQLDNILNQRNPGDRFEIVNSLGNTAFGKISGAFERIANDLMEPLVSSRIVKDGGYNDGSVDSKGGILGLNYSYERLSLFSIYYNGGKKTFGTGLVEALNSNDRARAWIEIRFRTSPGVGGNGQDSAGIQKRRFIEAELFGLYENGIPVEDQAVDIFKAFSYSSNSRNISNVNWRTQILEEILKHDLNGTVKNSNGNNAFELANKFLSSTPIGNVTSIKPLEEELKPAYDAIMDLYGPDTFALGPTNSHNIHFMNIHVGDDTDDTIDGFKVDAKYHAGNTDLEDNLIIAGKGNDTVNGGKGNDLIWGEEGADTINGGDGDDTLLGGSEGDTIDGGDDNDFIYGEAGDDTLTGGAGLDHIFGGDDNDTLDGGSGVDYLDGGKGKDTYIVKPGEGDTYIFDDDGELYIDTQKVTTLTKKAGIDDVYEDNLNNTWTLIGNVWSVTLQSGENIFIERENPFNLGGAIVSNEPQNNLSSLNNPVDLAGFDIAIEEADAVAENETTNTINDSGHITGTAANDQINGSNQDDEAYGFGGHDTISLGDDDDRGFGGEGNDRLYGGRDQDYLRGESGDDIIYAGNIDDVIDLGANTPASTERDILIGNDGDDTLIGSAGQNIIAGGRGVDTIIAGAGDDVIYGDSDLISHDNEWTVTLSNGTLTVDGVDGVIHEDEGDTDYIDAGSGNDFVIAQDGEDIVFGGLGDDESQRSKDNDAEASLRLALNSSVFKTNHSSQAYMPFC